MVKLYSIIPGLIIGAVLAGCATPLPVMTDVQYSTFANGWSVLQECTRSGSIDSDTAARGRAYMVSNISSYQYDKDRLVDLVNKLQNSRTVDVRECRDMSAGIHARKQQIENQNATAEIQKQEIQNIINSTKSTQTYCNRIGTQVLCNSF